MTSLEERLSVLGIRKQANLNPDEVTSIVMKNSMSMK